MTSQNSTLTLNSRFSDAIEAACNAIAPTWPLDKAIAVNPFWKQIDKPFAQVSAKLAALRQIQCVKTTEKPCASHTAWKNINEIVDSLTQNPHSIPWKDEVIQQVSQFCAAYFQKLDLSPTDQSEDLYANWLRITKQDVGISIVTNSPNLLTHIKNLPEAPLQLIEQALDELNVDRAITADYLLALLLDINGWASWVAYLEWQANLKNKPLSLMFELLAIRLAWELIIYRHIRSSSGSVTSQLQQIWYQQQLDLPNYVATHSNAQRQDWLETEKREAAFQANLEEQLLKSVLTPQTNSTPKLQAAFCIDVRSEPMRRALERCDAQIETLGFAGFFGLPIEYEVSGSAYRREQLPGLLSPSFSVSAKVDSITEVKRITLQSQKTTQQNWERHGLSSFSMVEAKGLMYAFKLLKQSFLGPQHHHPINHLDENLEFELKQGQRTLSIVEKADLAAGILKAMTLTKNFAPFVLLVGHGSHTTNNAQAAALDCGACGGQTGEVNARILATLLNDNDIRIELDKRNIVLPATTKFVAALHNTTNDEIRVLDTSLPSEITNWLKLAQQGCQLERASKFNIPPRAQNKLSKWFDNTCHDWSAVRPEWGLANNAALIVAKRHKTKGINLEGRCFLHEYDWQQDTDFSILELIMTAPMVVTNWINSQYNASVTDNLVYGSGNKLLHNVVGGHIGLFEGNGGDLRIGLAMQSLHDGEKWMHECLRLSVYIDAPKHEIEKIINKHTMVKQLIDNDWLYLHCMPSQFNGIERYYRGTWHIKENSFANLFKQSSKLSDGKSKPIALTD